MRQRFWKWLRDFAGNRVEDADWGEPAGTYRIWYDGTGLVAGDKNGTSRVTITGGHYSTGGTYPLT